ncbi:MAG: glycoside hydrolase family 2 TIM barrel-domain containing protein [Aristaeellaceae bacterium]
MKKNINAAWRFTKDAGLITPEHLPVAAGDWETVELPHTWNGVDGQDGGNDYHRGTCYYTRTLTRDELPDGEQLYLEFEAANASADVYVNGCHAGHHDGGYSLFRVEITPFLGDENVIVVAVDNSANDRVYPQNADFTFYGGLYRDVYVIGVPARHFELLENGTPGLRITPTVQGENAEVEVVASLTGLTGGETLSVTLLDEGAPVASAIVPAGEGRAVLTIAQVHLWHGRKDPHLYTCRAELMDGGTVLDARSIRFGCRTFRIDPEKGFFLNGESYPLRGVCRHQDRPGIGNALRPEHHREDVDLICEVGANTIRLAHYQHSQVFYDLCDERGLVIWAEIPYISAHMPGGRENTFSQMRELVTQNYNHPCIVVWGLSNEITMRTADPDDPDLLDNHVQLNDLVHRMDPTRLTTLAAVSMCPITAKCISIPDVISYNLYFGWYGGDTSMNGPWMDHFHEVHPDIPIGMSEYGCEALDWHTSTPECGDYTEEYQAHYHEELIKQLYTRPYIWATHVWNMFDFGCDARSEGGCEGRNNKGLVTFDRQYKKDSFYAYKAWLSDEPFVHICGKRYVERAEDVTKVTVYSNQPEVELLANGRSLGTQRSDVHFFYFEVPLAGEVTLTARAGAWEDTSRIVRVAEPNQAYIMREKGDVLNWFEIEAPEGYLSIRDRVGVIIDNPEGRQILLDAMVQRFGKEVDPGMLQACAQMPLRRMLSMGRSNGGRREMMLALNRRLNACKK